MLGKKLWKFKLVVMTMTEDQKRYTVVAVGCLLVLTSGGTASIASAENEIKKRLSLSQKQSRYLYLYGDTGRK